jgi:two-component system LytT family response regulator
MTMKRTTTLIAEDEPLASEGLAEWVRELPELELVGVRADGPRHPAGAARARPELVLMDIHMPGMNGLQVLRALAGDPGHPPPTVIFTTAYDEHAVAAFELHAVDYLLKPFSQERFVEAVRHALQASARATPPCRRSPRRRTPRSSR